MTRFLIAGLGSVGRRHLRNLLALGESALVLLRSGKSTLPEAELSGWPTERDFDSAMRRWRPDGVIVANPTALHLEVAIPAARAGCHLLIEKPLSHDLAGIDRLRAACAESGARVLTGFQFRFHPGLKEVKRILQEEKIGRPVFAAAHWGEYLPDWHPWEDYRRSYAAQAKLGGGVILTLCHPLDYLRWLLGEATVVSASAGHFGDLELDVEDTAQLTLQFSSGALGAVHLDFLQRPACHVLEVIGTRGTVRWESSDGAVELWSAAAQTWQRIPAPEGFARNDLFLEEMRHFIKVVQGEAQPVAGLEDGARAAELAVQAMALAQRREADPRPAAPKGAMQ